MEKCQVYLITTSDGVCYVGQSVRLKRRIQEHTNGSKKLSKYKYNPEMYEYLNHMEFNINSICEFETIGEATEYELETIEYFENQGVYLFNRFGSKKSENNIVF